MAASLLRWIARIVRRARVDENGGPLARKPDRVKAYLFSLSVFFAAVDCFVLLAMTAAVLTMARA